MYRKANLFDLAERSLVVHRNIEVTIDHVGIGDGSHAHGAVGAAALLGHSVLVVGALDGSEVVLGDGLGVVENGATVGAGSGGIQAAAGLLLAAVGVEGSLADGLQESQFSAVRLDRLDVVGVIGGEALGGLVVAEEGQCRVQTHDGMDALVADSLASVAGNVGTQAVANHLQAVQGEAMVFVQVLDHLTNLGSGSGNSQDGGGVVHGTSTGPVDHNDVVVALGEPGLGDAGVHVIGVLLGPAVDDEASAMVLVEVRSLNGAGLGLDLLAIGGVGLGVEVEVDGVGADASLHLGGIVQHFLGVLGGHPFEAAIGLGNVPAVLAIDTLFDGHSAHWNELVRIRVLL